MIALLALLSTIRIGMAAEDKDPPPAADPPWQALFDGKRLESRRLP